MELSEFRYKLRGGPPPTGPRNRAERRAAGRPEGPSGQSARDRDKRRRLDALRLAHGWDDRERTGRLIGRQAARGLAAREHYERAVDHHQAVSESLEGLRQDLCQAAREALLGGRSWDSLLALCRAAGWQACAAAEGQWPPRT